MLEKVFKSRTKGTKEGNNRRCALWRHGDTKTSRFCPALCTRIVFCINLGVIVFELCDLWRYSLTKFMQNTMRAHSAGQISIGGGVDVNKGHMVYRRSLVYTKNKRESLNINNNFASSAKVVFWQKNLTDCNICCENTFSGKKTQMSCPMVTSHPWWVLADGVLVRNLTFWEMSAPIQELTTLNKQLAFSLCCLIVWVNRTPVAFLLLLLLLLLLLRSHILHESTGMPVEQGFIKNLKTACLKWTRTD